MLWMTLTNAAPVAVMSTAMDGKSAIRFLCFLRPQFLLGDITTHLIQRCDKLRLASEQAKVQADAPA
jgi:hypothetical protein